ncbi:MAG: outer membrane protein assembly factor BamA [Holosporales bacterium]|jgi:outer membrane protein insertion porin family|nr:outer membrane protein assembly factor BamA [Holosporales bacterium]
MDFLSGAKRNISKLHRGHYQIALTYAQKSLKIPIIDDICTNMILTVLWLILMKTVVKTLKIFFFFAIFSPIEITNSAVIKDIQITGNVRIEKETILFEIPCKKGIDYDDNITDEVLKALNKTGYFKNITVNINNGVLTIVVQENPVINKIAYEGMSHSTRDAIKDIIKLKPRQVFSEAAVQETQQIILDIYRSQGCLSTQVTPKIVKLPNNRVDLVFEINEGSSAYVRKITFIGNDSFESEELKEILNIQEKRWFNLKVLGGTANKVYDPEKFIEDQKEIIRFYINRGYADFEIVSALAELSLDKKNFYVTYHIREGEIYKFGDISAESQIAKIDKKILEAGIMAKKGAIFNNQMIEVCSDIIKSIASSFGYNFAMVEPVFIKNSKKKVVDVKFIVKDGPKIFVEKINIKGNTHTRDFVIRRDIGFDEGDPFDQKKLKSTEERIKSLGFFKTVKVEPSEGERQDTAIVTVDVEEQSTGEIFAKAGYSTLEKASIGVHLYNPNFIGKGQSFGFDFVVAQKERDFSIDFAEPRLFGRKLLGTVSLFHNFSKRLTGLFRTQTGGVIGTGYQIRPRWYQNWDYKLHREELSIDSKKEKDISEKARRSNILLKDKKEYEDWLKTKDGKEFRKFLSSEDDEGVYWGSAVIHTIAYDGRNRRVLPSKGFKISWSTKCSGVGGNIYHLINTWSASWHHKIHKELIFNLRGAFSHAMGLGDHKLRTTDALFLGGESLRGFDFYGISPVRGLPKTKFNKAFDNFLAVDKPYLDDEQKRFLEDEKDVIRAFYTEGNKNLIKDYSKLSKWEKIFRKSINQENQKDALTMFNLQKVKGRKVGATLSWSASAELSFPMPIFPRDAEIFGTIFTDAGSAWRSLKNTTGNENDSEILHDKHEVRVAAGFSIAWHSPFGLLSFGYAWPLKKSEHDVTQKFLFGYGMKFN